MRGRKRVRLNEDGTQKLCIGCNTWKLLEEFTKNRQTRYPYCKACHADREWTKIMDRKTPAEIIGLIKQDEELAARRRLYLSQKYNLRVPYTRNMELTQ